MSDTPLAPRIHHFTTKASETGVPAHTLAMVDWGNVDDRVPIVCVHGLTRNARDFDALAPALAASGRRVIAISMAGRGESQWLDDPMHYTYATYVADCIAVMDNFHFRQVDWIGTSMGGIIGMIIASFQPDRIRKLLLNDIGAILKKSALERIFANVRAMPTRFATMAEAEAYIRNAYKTFGLTDAEWPIFINLSVQPTTDGGFRLACDSRIVEPLARDSKNFTEIVDVNLAEFWKQVECPTLILRGEQSDILDPETLSAMRAIHLSTQCITIPGVGHAPALLSAEQIAIVERWQSGKTSTGIPLAGL